MLGKLSHLSARAVGIVPDAKEIRDFRNRESKRTAFPNKPHMLHQTRIEETVIRVGAQWRPDQPELLIMPDAHSAITIPYPAQHESLETSLSKVCAASFRPSTVVR